MYSQGIICIYVIIKDFAELVELKQGGNGVHNDDECPYLIRLKKRIEELEVQAKYDPSDNWFEIVEELQKILKDERVDIPSQKE